MDIATSFKIERQGQLILRQLQWPAQVRDLGQWHSPAQPCSEWFHSAPPFRRMNLPTSPCCTMLSLCTDCPCLLHARINKTGSRFAIWILSSTCTHAHVCFLVWTFVHICHPFSRVGILQAFIDQLSSWTKLQSVSHPKTVLCVSSLLTVYTVFVLRVFLLQLQLL